MGLHCLLLTGDPRLLELMRTRFSAAGVELELRNDAASAIELSARRHLDSFVIDCDGVPKARDLLAQIRHSVSNKLSVVFAVVDAMTTIGAAVEGGADFVLGKPVQDGLLRSFLDIALPRMEREHRRYFRHKVELPIELSNHNDDTVDGKMINVSKDGLALVHFGLARLEGVVSVRFSLPSTQVQTFQARAAVVWNDNSATGLRFLRIDPNCRSHFEAWLDSLEAQLQFRESAQSSNAASRPAWTNR